MALSTILKVFAFVSILFTCILCISFVSIISALANKNSQRTIRHATNMCMSCDDLQSFPGFPAVSSEDIDRLRSAKDQSSCCASTDEILRMRIQKKMDEQVYEYNSGLSAELITDILGKNNCDLVQLDENVPRAKVVGLVDHVGSSFQTDLRKVRWNKNGASATNGDITHLEEEGEIFIRQDGTYVVLSKLRIHRNPSAPFTAKLSHVLYRFSHKYGSETVLLQRNRTLCRTSDDQYDSFISAVFRFHKYDRISIHTTHAQHLQVNDTENFFGVFYTYGMY
ncbi:uncharacterized protein LOC128219860 [Mya arenaria]|uniref:uncharacterized protein LOC128219860 n=1 Tax=Mya arenaria TaxID=6604 RepID=UPI0022E08C4A|nr:uncharacterized protein LOC128219860 [Mya arenaria]XP_052783949.1 uncharacterized protein LOC128219860 [Mya arenaria]